MGRGRHPEQDPSQLRRRRCIRCMMSSPPRGAVPTRIIRSMLEGRSSAMCCATIPGVKPHESTAVRAGGRNGGWCQCSARAQSETRGHCHQVRKRVGLHLAHHLTSVRLHGDLTDPEFTTDLFVQQPRDDQRHHLAFARRQRLIAVPAWLASPRRDGVRRDCVRWHCGSRPTARRP